MFKFLKEKISKWVKDVSKDKDKSSLEESSEELKEGTKKETKEKITKSEKKLKKSKKVKEKSTGGVSIPEDEEKKEGFFRKIAGKINKTKISQDDFEYYGEELKMILLENNVAFEVADKIMSELGERIVGKEFLKKEIETQIKDALKDILEKVLLEPLEILKEIKEKKENNPQEPFIVLFMGINGTGKTTTIAKISNFLKKENLSSVLASADTFRAASIEQLKEHGNKLGVPVISQEYGSDPAAVGFDAINYAKKNHIDVVLIDTAGRMHTSKNLLKEMEKINRVCKPNLKIFVGESITGNDVIEQAKSFDEEIGIDGIILTKTDVDEKGGSALSIGYITKKPIIFLGTGQLYDEIIPFNKKEFIERLKI
ncbi:signal recognition particle-docking protein FtsY [Patescibacteria group bacterium]|nr:signal recognition particle-docking protein FtsY [Patescibacteria group bacterium]